MTNAVQVRTAANVMFPDGVVSPQEAADREAAKLIDVTMVVHGPKFIIPELRRVAEVLWGTEVDPRNFHRVWTHHKLLRKTGEQRIYRGHLSDLYTPRET